MLLTVLSSSHPLVFGETKEPRQGQALRATRSGEKDLGREQKSSRRTDVGEHLGAVATNARILSILMTGSRSI
ncbi:MAG: hypothetical protein HC936_17300 [Leptolyngbyaceae cyanobacterium SU_3_3]|nr:hypothetical protein [Leptolyngbyaceae cyanobacterium SU_3_3]NJR50574.1 hypothetical protein [Leptolyngbyaceae cyanobacterium CSU_1_3]